MVADRFLLALIAVASTFGAARSLRCVPSIRTTRLPQLAAVMSEDVAAAAPDEKEVFPKDADGKTLITYESLDKVQPHRRQHRLVC